MTRVSRETPFSQRIEAMQTYASDSFSFDIPAGWEFSSQASSIAVFKTIGGKGALNISEVAPPPGTSVNAEQLLLAISSGFASGEPLINAEGNEVGIAGESIRESRFWRYWVLYDKRQAVVVSYNCRLDNKDAAELSEAEGLVSSISLG